MAFNVQQFINSIGSQNEFAMSNKFEARIWIPPVMNGTIDSKYLAFRCDAAELPGVEITAIEFTHYGFKQKIPHHLNFAPLTLSFYVTSNMSERTFFDVWMDRMIGFNTGLASYPLDTSGGGVNNFARIDLVQFDVLAYEQYIATVIDAFPISIAPMSLNWGGSDTHRLQVTFAYKKWLTVDTKNVTVNAPPGNVTETLPKSSGGQDTSNVSNNTNPPSFKSLPDPPTIPNPDISSDVAPNINFGP